MGAKEGSVKEIAQRAGVSIAAAYAVLNPRERTTIGVSQEKRQRILDTASEMGYVRNEIARSLARGKTNTIGVFVHSLENNFYGTYFSVFDKLACQAGYAPIISSCEYAPERAKRSIQSFIDKRVDGIVVSYSSLYNIEELLMLYQNLGGKIVWLADPAFKGAPNFLFDEKEAARLQAERLWQRGCRKAIHLNAGAIANVSSGLSDIRFARFKEEWMSVSGEAPIEIKASNQLYPGPETLSALVDAILRGGATGIACSMDTLGMWAVSSLETLGMKVPEKVAVVGLDDIETNSTFFKPLTTVRLPTDILAEETWKAMKNMLDGGTPEEGAKVIKPILVERRSA